MPLEIKNAKSLLILKIDSRQGMGHVIALNGINVILNVCHS